MIAPPKTAPASPRGRSQQAIEKLSNVRTQAYNFADIGLPDVVKLTDQLDTFKEGLVLIVPIEIKPVGLEPGGELAMLSQHGPQKASARLEQPSHEHWVWYGH